MHKGKHSTCFENRSENREMAPNRTGLKRVLGWVLNRRGKSMIRRIILALACTAALTTLYVTPKANAQAFNQQWGQSYSTQDWNRMYHYPYVYYPQNFWGPDYYRSSGNMYYRYPPEMQIPVYNRQWHNEYPQERRYYGGHHFNLDVF